MKNLIIATIFYLGASTVHAATLTLHLHCLIQGYYTSGGQMTPAAYNESCPWAVPGMTDRVLIQLRKKSNVCEIVGQVIAVLNSNGYVDCNISHPLLTDGDYYIIVKNSRNALETWSSTTVHFSVGVTTNYDFTTFASQAYGNNQVLVDGYWCFYSGDCNHDGCINKVDKSIVETDVLNFAYGCLVTDLNGDVNVDLLDLNLIINNILTPSICVKKPCL